MSLKDAVTPWRASTTDGASGRVEESAAEQTTVLQYEWQGVWVVVPYGEYDMHTIRPLEEALQAAAMKYPKVILDVSHVTFADSALLNVLIGVHMTTTLRVVAPRPQFRRLLEITGADTILGVCTTVEKALVS